MPTQPLQPFSPPQALPFLNSSILSLRTLLLFFLLFTIVYWIVETIISIYHWWVYAHSPKVAVPSISLHLGVSFVLLVYTLSGLL
jgi:hypothetical protein